jgi:hypothetical protein
MGNMRVDETRVHNIVDIIYSDSDKLQFVRELVQNSIEGNASRIKISYEKQGEEMLGVKRFLIQDDGKGMSAEELTEFLNELSSSGKEVGVDKNYGIGAKTSTLPWNPLGVVFVSWTSEDDPGAMIWLYKQRTGLYGAREFEDEEGDLVEALPLDQYDEGIGGEYGVDFRLLREGWNHKSGSAVLLLGSHIMHDTYNPQLLKPNVSKDEFTRYLAQRYKELSVPVSVMQYQADGRNSSGFRSRKLKTLSSLEEVYIEAQGSIDLSDELSIEWRLLANNRTFRAAYFGTGFIAFENKGELFHHKRHPQTWRSFGIHQKQIWSRLFIVIKDKGLIQNAARTQLKNPKTDADPDFAVVGEYFRTNLPEYLLNEQRKLIAEKTNNLELYEYRKRLASEYGERFNDVLGPGGAKKRTAAKKAKPKQGELEGVSGQNKTPPGHDNRKRKTGFPEWRWDGDHEEESVGYWVPPGREYPDGCIFLNAAYSVFTEIKQRFASRIGEEYQELGAGVIHKTIGSYFVTKIAHALRHKKVVRWGVRGVNEQLLSDGALTMISLGFFGIEHAIEDALRRELKGGFLGK